MKKIVSIFLAISMIFCLAGCAEGVSEPSSKSNSEDVFIWTDKETGVQYIIYSNSAGYSGMGGITPRLNADGTLYGVDGND